jgi:Na+-transporting NADH:ubiquinone oxidoreductase subunit A
MNTIQLKKGYDVPIDGSPESDLGSVEAKGTIALRPCDFAGVKFRLLVKEGESVKVGTPLVQSKTREDWVFTSPAGGTIKSINRGHRRALMSIEIEPDAEEQYEEFPAIAADKFSSLTYDAALETLLKSGLFNVFKQRPFNVTASPDLRPRDIFISTFDTAPLAADPNVIVKGNEEAFKAGLLVCKALTTGSVRLGIAGKGDVPAVFAKPDAEVTAFTGPHPAGCVGIQIHHTKPIANRNDVVWTTTVQGAILIGKLFLTGKIDPSIVIALAGSEATERKHFKTRLGVSIASIVSGRITDGNVRIVSGNVLTGSKVSQEDHLGTFDNLVTVIPEADEPEFMGWAMPGAGKSSIFRAFLSKLAPGKKFAMDTNLNGGRRAFVFSDVYEDVLPMDILPQYLIKSCMYEDIEEMEQLGIYELSEEEVALCEYICPSKTEFQAILRAGMDLIEREG